MAYQVAGDAGTRSMRTTIAPTLSLFASCARKNEDGRCAGFGQDGKVSVVGTLENGIRFYLFEAKRSIYAYMSPDCWSPSYPQVKFFAGVCPYPAILIDFHARDRAKAGINHS